MQGLKGKDEGEARHKKKEADRFANKTRNEDEDGQKKEEIDQIADMQAQQIEKQMKPPSRYQGSKAISWIQCNK